MAGTSRDLESLIDAGQFREDLYYRVNVFSLHVPALRERRDDIPALMAVLGAEAERRHGTAVRLDLQALETLIDYDWPGNLRELANLVERLAIAGGGDVIGADDLPPKIRSGRAVETKVPGSAGAAPEARQADAPSLDPERPPLLPVNGIDLKDYLARLERSLIAQALEDTDAVIARAADRLQIRRTTLVEKMRKYGMRRTRADH